jgi:Predicted membrane protein
MLESYPRRCFPRGRHGPPGRLAATRGGYTPRWTREVHHETGPGTGTHGAALAAAPLIAAKGDNLRLDTDIGSILGYILVGMIVGLLARLLVPGRDPVGLLGTLVIGVIGAVLGGWLAGAFFKETAGVDWLASIGVAVLLVLLVRAGSRRSAWR